MNASIPLMLVLILTLSGLFGGPSGKGAESGQSLSKSTTSDVQVLQEKSKEKKPNILCSWIGYGRQETMCFREDMSAAQKKCNEYASKQLGEPVECSCTGDQSYIQGACD